MRKIKISLFVLVILILSISLTGCAAFDMFMKDVQGSLVGIDYKMLSYDAYGNNTLTAQGKNINIGLFENYANVDKDSTGFKSEVLEITAEGKQLLHVGSTMIFAEKGIDMIQDFDVNWLKNASTNGRSTLVPVDRTINSFMNKIGKKKTIVVRSQMGIVIGVYQGDNVGVEVPSDLPKMTRLVVDGKSLYIYRADYDIFDSSLFKQN